MAAVVLPSAVLVAAALRLWWQESELASRRHAEERSALVAALGRGLDDAAMQSVAWAMRADAARESTTPPGLVLLAPLGNRGPVLPWRPARKASGTDVEPEYERLLRLGERAEFAERRPAAAAALYLSAGAAAARDGVGEARAEALLRRARALSAAGRVEEAGAAWGELADLPVELVDGDGVPFALYGADGLRLQDPQRAREVVRRVLDAPRPWSPVVLHFSASLVGEGPEMEEVRERLPAARRLVELEREWPAVRGALEGAPRAASRALEPANGVETVPWVPFGEPPWMVGVLSEAPEGGGERVAVLDPAPLLAAVGERAARSGDASLADAAGRGRLVRATTPGAERLGGAFSGWAVALPADLPPPPDPWAAGRWLFVLVVPVVLGVTLFTAWLSWRDVRREVEAARLRSRFVSGVSHELRTPLTSIRMFAETLRLRRTDAATRAEYLDTIVGESERLTRLVDDVLDFARAERGEERHAPEPVRLQEIVREAARAMARPLADGGFVLDLSVDETIPPVAADRDALVRALLNLLSNAMKFSGDGRRIDLEMSRADGEVRITVRDRGIGIEPEEHRAIFRDFYRSPAAEERGIRGAGLGLALVWHVARAHGGTVDLESEPGEGSAFTLRIPAAS